MLPQCAKAALIVRDKTRNKGQNKTHKTIVNIEEVVRMFS